jgi:hypothetical protein
MGGATTTGLVLLLLLFVRGVLGFMFGNLD